jgi:hypothetical protein
MKASLIGLIMVILALAAIAPASLDAQTSAPPAQAGERTRAGHMRGLAANSSPGGEDRALTLTTIRPFDVATYIETLQQTHAPPGVKQQLAAVRMLFGWLTKRAEVTFSGVPDIAAVIAAVGVAGYECMVENANSSNLI